MDFTATDAVHKTGCLQFPDIVSEGLLHIPKPNRYRSLSLSDVDGGFCQMEVSIPAISETDLPELVTKADHALKSGVSPCLADGCCGGTYFLRDATSRHICLVFKPGDEEPYAPNNPHLKAKDAGRFHKAYKGNILPGFGLYRELIAFALDSGSAGVPATQLAKVRHESLRTINRRAHSYKIGSIQSYVREIECTAEDMGPGMINKDDIQRVALLDIRLCNLDRHPGNLLVCHSKRVATIKVQPKQSRQENFSDEMNLISESSPRESFSKSYPNEVGSYFSGGGVTMIGRYGNQKHDIERSSTCSPSPRSIKDNGTSPRGSVTEIEAGKLRLVPIDHGYCLPHVLHLSETNFSWLYWAQVATPISEDLRNVIDNLDAHRDCVLVKDLVGEAIPDTYLLTLHVCTMLVQVGIKAGLTLRDIGELMTPPPVLKDEDSTIALSPLQLSVYKAVKTVLMKQCTVSMKGDLTPVRGDISVRMKHSPSVSSLLDIPCHSFSSPSNSKLSPTKSTSCQKLLHDDCCVCGAVTCASLLRDPAKDETSAASIERFDTEVCPCSEGDLQRAMLIDNGSALLESFHSEILILVSSKKV